MNNINNIEKEPVGDFRPKIGQRSRGKAERENARFLNQVKTTCNKNMKLISRRSGASSARASGSFGKGRYVADPKHSAQRVTVKGRIVKTGKSIKEMKEHVRYISREGVEKDGSPTKVFNEVSDEMTKEELKQWTDKCENDRHTFRFIVSPENGEDLDLRAYSRELVRQMETDLNTKLQWVAVNHHDTDNPHTHILIRGKTDAGKDLVMKREYIGQGIRGRASEIATRHLGRRTEQDIIRQTIKDIPKERLTNLDREMIAKSRATGQLDLSKTPTGQYAKNNRNAMLQRVNVLKKFGLAEEVAPGKWRINSEAEKILRRMGERGDIIKTMHSKLRGQQAMPPCVIYQQDTQTMKPVKGIVIDKGLSDELSGDKYVVVKATDGNAYYVTLSRNSEKAMRQSEIGSVVSITPKPDSGVALETLSRQPLAEQVKATGPTWLDAELSRQKSPEKKLLSPMECEIEAAKKERARELQARGLASFDDRGNVRLNRDVYERLECAEFDRATAKYAAQGFKRVELKTGDEFTGKIDRIERLSDGPYCVMSNAAKKEVAIVPYRTVMDQAHSAHSVKQDITVSISRQRTGYAPARVDVQGKAKTMTRGKGFER